MTGSPAARSFWPSVRRGYRHGFNGIGHTKKRACQHRRGWRRERRGISGGRLSAPVHAPFTAAAAPAPAAHRCTPRGARGLELRGASCAGAGAKRRPAGRLQASAAHERTRGTRDALGHIRLRQARGRGNGPQGGRRHGNQKAFRIQVLDLAVA
jgi:hypothetical protein